MTRRSNRHDACHDAPLQRRAQPRARAQSAGGRPGGRALRLQRHAAPTRTAHAAVAREALRRTLVHEMMSETHLPAPSPSAGARSAPCTKRLDRRKAHDVFDLPSIPRRQRAQPGEHMWALGRAAPTPLVPSAQREAATGLPYRRPGAQRPRHRRRARSARRRWQPAAVPPGTQARSALGAQRCAPSAERRARSARRRSGSPQAPGAQGPRGRGERGEAAPAASWHAPLRLKTLSPPPFFLSLCFPWSSPLPTPPRAVSASRDPSGARD